MDLLAKYAPIIGLMFFFVIFLVVLVSLLRPGAKQRCDKFAKIPLEEK